MTVLSKNLPLYKLRILLTSAIEEKPEQSYQELLLNIR